VRPPLELVVLAIVSIDINPAALVTSAVLVWLVWKRWRP